MNVPELFNLLESNEPQLIHNAKKKLEELFNMTKDSWLLNGIFDYYLLTNSSHALEVLLCIKEPHYKYLFDKICDSLKGTCKLQTLEVLNHVVRHKPSWLCRIIEHQLFMKILKLLKNNHEILPLLSGLMILVDLIPMIPASIGPYLQDIFDVFSRLAAWNLYSTCQLIKGQLIYLQITLHALFLRLYGMYPCNFISHLRKYYHLQENKPVFTQIISPMLTNVRIHPRLILNSNDDETSAKHWKKKHHHDIVVECENLSLDTTYSSFTNMMPYYVSQSHSNMRSNQGQKPLTIIPMQNSDNGDINFWSPTLYFQQQSESTLLTSKYQQLACNTSQTETAIEATPETTPSNDTRRIRTRRSLPVLSINLSNISRALNRSQSSSPKRKNTVLSKKLEVVQDKEKVASVPTSPTHHSNSSADENLKTQKLISNSSSSSSVSSNFNKKCSTLEESENNEIFYPFDSWEFEEHNNKAHNFGPSYLKRTFSCPDFNNHKGISKILSTPHKHVFEDFLNHNFQTPKHETHFSPRALLDKYIEKAASSGNSNQSEVEHLREQLSLLHMQFQYERYRCKIHADRYRTLLNKLRKNRALEEHKAALSDQLIVLGNEIDILRENLLTKELVIKERDKDLEYWSQQCRNIEFELKQLRRQNEILNNEISIEKEKSVRNLKNRHEAEALLFEVQGELKATQKTVNDFKEANFELEKAKIKLLLIGELNEKYRKNVNIALEQGRSRAREEYSELLHTYRQEINNLKHQLDFKTIQSEKLKAHYAELEAVITQQNKLNLVHKNTLEQSKEEYHERLCALQSKYDTQRAINRTLEEHILLLWQKIEVQRSKHSRLRKASTNQNLTENLLHVSSCYEPLSLSVISCSEDTEKNFSALMESENESELVQNESTNGRNESKHSTE